MQMPLASAALVPKQNNVRDHDAHRFEQLKIAFKPISLSK